MKTATVHNHPENQNGRRHASKANGAHKAKALTHQQSARRRTDAPVSITKPHPPTIRVAGLVDSYGDFCGLAANHPENLRFRGEVEKTVTVTFDEPQRWRLCFTKFSDLPEWRPQHVLETPPTLRGATDEIFHEVLPFLESREAAMQACAECNASKTTHGSSAPDDRRWAFVVEFGHAPKTTISLLTEFASDTIGVEEFTTRRVVRVVVPTAAERAEFDGLEVAGDLPVTGGDPAKFRVYGIAVAKHHFRKWLGDFETAAEARDAAAGFKADRADDGELAFVVVSPGPLPGVEELRQVAAKGAKGD